MYIEGFLPKARTLQQVPEVIIFMLMQIKW
jgi:hypothetical protein